MNQKTVSLLLGAALVGLLIFLNFDWNGPDDPIEHVRWVADGSPSWIEWQIEEVD